MPAPTDRACAFLAAWLAASLAALPATATQPGPAYTPVHALVARYGLPAPSGGSTNLTIETPDASLTLESDSRRVLCNGVVVWLNDPVLLETNTWFISRADAGKILDLLLGSPELARPEPGFTVVLDPGHGGMDAGAVSADTNLVEKTLVLDLALRVARHLASEELGVVFTRTNDIPLPLPDRTRLARDREADAFVSIHGNWAENTNAAGIETFVLSASPPPKSLSKADRQAATNRVHDASILLAYHVHRALISATEAPDRGIRNARFEVIRNAPCPAILVECGFLSNALEAARLADETYREFVAESLARGIRSYLTRLRRP